MLVLKFPSTPFSRVPLSFHGTWSATARRSSRPRGVGNRDAAKPHAAHHAGDACMRDRHRRCALDLHASVLRPLRPQSEGACLATSLPPVPGYLLLPGPEIRVVEDEGGAGSDSLLVGLDSAFLGRTSIASPGACASFGGEKLGSLATKIPVCHLSS